MNPSADILTNSTEAGLVPSATIGSTFPVSPETSAVSALTFVPTYSLHSLARDAECPFVNRADPRCSAHLSLGGMAFAYDHCFDAFGGCPVHDELEAERLAELTIARRPFHRPAAPLAASHAA